MQGIITYTRDAETRIKQFNIDKEDIEKRIIKIAKQFVINMQINETREIGKEFPCEKTWNNYFIVGTLQKIDKDKFNITINSIGVIDRNASKDKNIKIYKVTENKEGLSLREHIEMLKRKRNKEIKNNKAEEK